MMLVHQCSVYAFPLNSSHYDPLYFSISVRTKEYRRTICFLTAVAGFLNKEALIEPWHLNMTTLPRMPVLYYSVALSDLHG